MDKSLLEHMDRLSAKGSLRSRYGSVCGVIATLGLLALIVWMYYWAVLDFSLGWFFQTSFQIPQASVQKFQIPYDLKAAIVFYSKTTNQPVNHTLLADTLKIRVYQNSVVSTTQYYQSMAPCRSDYFADSINPVTMTDCFIFPDNLAFDFYYQNTVASWVGMYMTFGCLNPFFCKSGNAVYTTAQNNFSNIYNTSYFVVYFATKVIQPDGSFRYQVNTISSSEWNTPYTISSTFDAEIQSINTTIDDSIWPWRNNKTTSSLSWFGMAKGISKNASAMLAPLPKVNFVSSYYQNQVFRYYKKIDWLLGIIGGGMSLFFILLWIPLQYLNRSFQHSSYAQELLIDYKNNFPTTVRDLKPVRMSFLYPLKRLIGCSDPYEDQLKDKVDIAKIIGKLKVAQRNIEKLNMNIYAKERRLVFQEDLTKECPENAELQDKKIIVERLEDDVENRGNNVERNSQSNDNSYAILNGSSAGIKAEERFQELNIQSPVKEPDIHPQLENIPSNQPQPLEPEANSHIQILNEPKFEAPIEQKQALINSANEHMSIVQKVPEPEDLIDFSNKVHQQEKKKQHEKEPRSQAQLSKSERSPADKEEERSKRDERQSQQNRPPSQYPKSNRQHQDEAGRSSHLPMEPHDIIVAEFPITDDEQLLNMQKEVIVALSESNQAKSLYPGKGVVILLNQQNQNEVQEFMETEKYNNLDVIKVETRCEKFLSCVAAFVRRFDFFGVKPDFINSPANASVIGCLITLAIVTCAVITFALTIQNSSSYQIVATKDFQSPQEISYKLITGYGFRPAVCFLSTGAAKLTGSGQTVTLQFYSYSASSGSIDIPTIQMNSGETSLLGIPKDGLFSTLATQFCWRMQDGYEIPIGGPGPNEAYFGFRINGYCSGTVSYCNSVVTTTRSNTATFLNTYPMTLYLPINQYSPRSNSVYEGGVFNQVLKEGTANIVYNSTVQQTVYVDRVELIDAYSSNFVGQSYPILQQSICSSRYQQNEFTRPIPNTYPGYELRIRPSGVVNKIIQKGNSLEIILGIVGGVLFIWYFIFSCIGKSYNAFNVRARLAQQIYYEEGYENSFFLKCCHLLSYPILFACGMCKQDLKRMRQVDKKIKEDLEAIELIKDVDTCYRLSAAKLPSETRMIGLIPFKQKVDEKQSMNAAPPEAKVQQEFMSEVFIGEQSESQASTNKVNNQFEVAIVNEANQNSEKVEEQNQKQDDKLNENIDQIAAESQNRGPYSRTNSKWRSFMAAIDLFSCDTELSLFGQWRIKSVFGTLMTMAVIGIGLTIYTYFINLYVMQKNYTISYQKYISPTVLNESLQLNDNNFRFAIGFYTKPNFAFLNVSTLVNSTVSGTVGISVYQDSLEWQGSAFTFVENRYDLVPCASNYFSNYVNANIDPNYYANLGLSNGFCLPTGITFNLTGMNPKKMDYFRISIYNKTSTSTALTTLTSTYVVGCLMTVPVINLQGRTFNYSVQQIRMNNEVVIKSYEFNITLSRQEMQFPNPIDGSLTVMQSYGYEENRVNDRGYLASSSLSTVSRTYNVTFSYAGFVQRYITVYTKPSQLFGLAGGIFTLFLMIAGYLAYSFNRFRMIYLVGQKLYAFTLKKKRQSSQDAALLREINDYSEGNLFWAWLLSFPAAIINRYDWNNTLRRVSVIQKRASQDLDLYRFYSRFTTVRDTLNQQLKLEKYPNLLLTNLYSKELVPQESWQYVSQGSLKITAKYHGLSSRDQWLLEQAQNAEMPLNDFMSQASQQIESQVALSEVPQGQVMQLEKQGEVVEEQVMPPPPPSDLPLEKLFEFDEVPADVEPPVEPEKKEEVRVENAHVVEQLGFEEIGESEYSDSQN